MATIKNIIFDLGGVLIDWNPDYLYDKIITDTKERAYFFKHVCPMEWNENQDAGYPLAQAMADRVALFPHYKDWIELYYGRWEEMLGEAIEGTVDILKTCVESPEYKVVALTNWSAETFPIAQKRFEFLQWFEGILVSGEEKMRKPFPEIYALCLDRFALKAEESLFIDDNLRNIKAAEALGIPCIHFSSPKQLAQALNQKNISI